MSAIRRLVVNADDFGFVASVNRGIVEAIETGVVTSTSLMVNTPGTQDAKERLEALLSRGRTVGVGLHFNIVVGSPLTRPASLMDLATGRFAPLQALAWRAWRRRIDAREVEAELEAQLERARTLLSPLGLRATHIDSHRHSHCIPGIFEVVTHRARHHGIAHVRHPHEHTTTLLGRAHAIVATRALRALIGDKPAFDDIRFTGVALMRSATVEADLLRLIDALPEGTTELMMHPGYDSPELAAIDSYRAPRERELRALTSPRLRERLRERNVELVSFGATAPAA